jgi:hypothetical protein
VWYREAAVRPFAANPGMVEILKRDQSIFPVEAIERILPIGFESNMKTLDEWIAFFTEKFTEEEIAFSLFDLKMAFVER